MAIGAKGSSLLHKMNQQQAHEMSFDELCTLVRQAQEYRTKSRGITRLQQAMKRQNAKAMKSPTLDQLGLAPALVERLRTTGTSEAKLIQTLREKGLI